MSGGNATISDVLFYTLLLRGRLTPAAGLVSGLPQLLFAACQLTPTPAAACADPRQRLSPEMAAADASDGCRTDGSCVESAQSAVVSGATVATALSPVRGR